MPRYYKDHCLGYDLTEELPFFEMDGDKYILGSSGSFIIICTKCGRERYRERITNEELSTPCLFCHGKMEPHTFDNLERYRKLWGKDVVPTSELKAARIKQETGHPWGWKFGNKTEADFPLGYAVEFHRFLEEVEDEE
jgi:hypothetical protein